LSFDWGGLTPKLTGAEARSAKGTDMGHENAEGMAHVGVHVERTVRLLREEVAVEVRAHYLGYNSWL
jgi:hypothetical protein